MEQVKLYDTTLRDGMGGRGMSLSVGEKLQRGAGARRARRAVHRGRLPEQQPEGSGAVRAARRARAGASAVAAFGMTRRRGVEAADDAALVGLAESFAPVVCLVGKSWGLHVEKVTRVSREENLAMIAESVAFCRDARQAAGLRRRALLRRLPRGRRPTRSNASARRPTAGAENVTLCDTNGGSLPDFVAAATAAVVAALGGAVEVGIHTHDDSGCAVANSLAAVEAGARLVQGCVNGYGERCGNANLASILPALQLKMGFEVVSAEQLASLTPDRPLPRRALQPRLRRRPRPTSAATPSPTRGGCTPPGSRPTPAPSSTSTRRGRQRPRHPALGARRQGDVRSQAEQAGIEIDDEATARAVERLKEREHAGYHYEAAPASFELLLRREAGHLQAAVQTRELPGRDRAAGRGRGRDRGDDQGRGRRRALPAGRRGQRPGQRARQRAALGDHRAATRTSPRSS